MFNFGIFHFPPCSFGNFPSLLFLRAFPGRVRGFFPETRDSFFMPNSHFLEGCDVPAENRNLLTFRDPTVFPNRREVPPRFPGSDYLTE